MVIKTSLKSRWFKKFAWFPFRFYDGCNNRIWIWLQYYYAYRHWNEYLGFSGGWYTDSYRIDEPKDYYQRYNSIKFELWPFGLESQKQSLGHATITNIGGTNTSGEYKATLFTKGDKPRVWKAGKVFGFPRLKLGGWDLLYRALRELIGERNV